MKVGGAAQATHLRVFDGEMHFSQSRHDRCPGAHGAGFLGHDSLHSLSLQSPTDLAAIVMAIISAWAVGSFCLRLFD